jgi:hypothetical protein
MNSSQYDMIKKRTDCKGIPEQKGAHDIWIKQGIFIPFFLLRLFEGAFFIAFLVHIHFYFMR